MTDTTQTKKARAFRFFQRRPELLFTPTLVVVLLTLWEFTTRLVGIPTYILPLPSEIGAALVKAVGSSQVWANVGLTAFEASAGFAIAVCVAFLIAAVIAIAPAVEEFVMPYIVTIQTIPTVALAPLLLIWLGFGESSKVALAAISAFFPIVINTIVGLKTGLESRLEVAEAFGANRWQVLRMVKVPSALPHVFAGLEVGIIFAMLGAVIGEFAGAKAGLGYQVLEASYRFDLPGMFAALVFLAAMGLLAQGAVTLLRRGVVYWER